MTITYVLMQNLKRNPLRAALTALAFALPMAVFVAALSFVVVMGRIRQESERNLRLGVRSKTTVINLLPEGTRKKIEAMDPDRKRLLAICGMRWFGGRVPNAQNTLTSLAADADTFPIVYAELAMTPEDVAQWQRERRSCVVGQGPAEQYGWRPGDRLVLESTVPPYLSLEFHVVKIITHAARQNFFYFRRDYLDESLKEAGEDYARCNIFWIKCASAEGLRSLQTEIDAAFANSPEETKSDDENAFMANFIQSAGDIPGLMRAIAMVVVILVALVAGNTMMMSFRERTRELAVFKAIGFQSRRVFTIVLAESTMLAVIGAVIGVVPTAFALVCFPVRLMRMGPISAISVSPFAVAGSFGIAIVVGVAAGLWPAYRALRLRTVDALRNVA